MTDPCKHPRLLLPVKPSEGIPGLVTLRTATGGQHWPANACPPAGTCNQAQLGISFQNQKPRPHFSSRHSYPSELSPEDLMSTLPLGLRHLTCPSSAVVTTSHILPAPHSTASISACSEILPSSPVNAIRPHILRYKVGKHPFPFQKQFVLHQMSMTCF